MPNPEKPSVNTERQLITIEEEIEEPTGTLAEVVQYIAELQQQYGKYQNVTLNYVPITYQDYQYEIKYERLETDDELAERIETEQKAVDEWLKTQQKEQLKQQILDKKERLQQELTQLDSELKKLN
jgi:hypothetical protein